MELCSCCGRPESFRYLVVVSLVVGGDGRVWLGLAVVRAAAWEGSGGDGELRSAAQGGRVVLGERRAWIESLRMTLRHRSALRRGR